MSGEAAPALPSAELQENYFTEAPLHDEAQVELVGAGRVDPSLPLDAVQSFNIVTEWSGGSADADAAEGAAAGSPEATRPPQVGLRVEAQRSDYQIEWLVEKVLRQEFVGVAHPTVVKVSGPLRHADATSPLFAMADKALRSEVLCRYTAAVLEYYLRHPVVADNSLELHTFTSAASAKDITTMMETASTAPLAKAPSLKTLRKLGASTKRLLRTTPKKTQAIAAAEAADWVEYMRCISSGEAERRIATLAGCYINYEMFRRRIPAAFYSVGRNLPETGAHWDPTAPAATAAATAEGPAAVPAATIPAAAPAAAAAAPTPRTPISARGGGASGVGASVYDSLTTPRDSVMGLRLRNREAVKMRVNSRLVQKAAPPQPAAAAPAAAAAAADPSSPQPNDAQFSDFMSKMKPAQPAAGGTCAAAGTATYLATPRIHAGGAGTARDQGPLTGLHTARARYNAVKKSDVLGGSGNMDAVAAAISAATPAAATNQRYASCLLTLGCGELRRTPPQPSEPSSPLSRTASSASASSGGGLASGTAATAAKGKKNRRHPVAAQPAAARTPASLEKRSLESIGQYIGPVRRGDYKGMVEAVGRGLEYIGKADEADVVRHCGRCSLGGVASGLLVASQLARGTKAVLQAKTRDVDDETKLDELGRVKQVCDTALLGTVRVFVDNEIKRYAQEIEAFENILNVLHDHDDDEDADLGFGDAQLDTPLRGAQATPDAVSPPVNLGAAGITDLGVPPASASVSPAGVVVQAGDDAPIAIPRLKLSHSPAQQQQQQQSPPRADAAAAEVPAPDLPDVAAAAPVAAAEAAADLADVPRGGDEGLVRQEKEAEEEEARAEATAERVGA